MIQHQKTASTSKLILSSVLTMLPGITYGATLSYIAVALPFFMNPLNQSGIVLDVEESSWFASLNNLSRMVGCILTGVLSERIGRRPTILISIIITSLGAFAMYLADSFWLLLAGSVVVGFGTGITLNPSYSLLAEISTIRLRGSLGSMNTLMANIGYLYTLGVGMLVPVIYLPMVMIAPSLLFIGLFWFVPRSPVWLMQKGREEDARNTLQYLRGKKYNIQPELKEMEDIIARGNPSGDQSSKSVLCREFIIPAVIIFVLFVFQSCSGADTISYFILIIFKDFVVDENLMAIIFQIAITVGYILSSPIMTRVDRRLQFILASFGFMFGLASMGMVPFLPDNQFTSYIPVLSIIICGLSYGTGVGPVPFVMMSELFNTKYKSVGLAVAMLSRSFCVFFQLKLFSSLQTLLGMTGIFFIHTLILAVGVIFTFAVVPETRNKSISELEDIFKSAAKLVEEGYNEKQEMKPNKN